MQLAHSPMLFCVHVRCTNVESYRAILSLSRSVVAYCVWCIERAQERFEMSSEAAPLRASKQHGAKCYCSTSGTEEEGTGGDYGSVAAERNMRLADQRSSDEATRLKSVTSIKVALLICFIFMVAEIVGGYIAHSLAIITDAAHLLTDVGSFTLALFSIHTATKAACKQYTFGWHRAEVVGTLASVFSIWAMVSIILFEAVNRIFIINRCSHLKFSRHESSHEAKIVEQNGCVSVSAPIMVIMGSMGLAVNVACAAILSYGGGGHGHSHMGTVEHHHDTEEEAHGHSHNHGHHRSSERGLALSGAFIHALGDCVQSLGVIIAAAIIWICNVKHFGVSTAPTSIYNLADPLASIFFGLVTLYTTNTLVWKLFAILMEKTPDHIDTAVLALKLGEIDGVKSVHDLHVWSLSAGKSSLSVHLVANNHAAVLKSAQCLCENSYGITHTTIQVDPVAVGAENCCSDIH